MNFKNIEKCNNSTFLVEINNEYLRQIVLPFLDPKNNFEQIKEFEEILNKKIFESHFLKCKKHLNETYNYIIDIFNSFWNVDEEKLKIKNVEKLNQIGFSKFPFKNMSELFAYKVNDWFCNKTYSNLFKRKDNLRKSIIQKLTSQLKITEEEFQSISNKESEFIWFMENKHYTSIPINWQKNFILEKYIGGGFEQGKLNGPDFIFKDTVTGETYGFEILELNKLLFDFSNGFRDISKFLENITKQIQKRGGSIENYLRTIIIEVDKKVEKWKKYQITNYKFIGLINHSVPDEWYIIFELIINTLYINQDKINGIIFL